MNQESEKRHDKSNTNRDGKETFASATLFFLENCTAHGLPRIAAEKSIFRKIVWVVIFAGAFGYFVFTLQNIINKFLRYEVNVNTKISVR